jgi:predicted nucleic acid-binding protein
MLKQAVCNTSPIICLMAGLGTLAPLYLVFDRVIIPFEVIQELSAGGTQRIASNPFAQHPQLHLLDTPQQNHPSLHSLLGAGEASVITAALCIAHSVCVIDELAGRRQAQLSGLAVTGSLGVMLAAQSKGFELNRTNVLNNLHMHGLWLSAEIKNKFLNHVPTP